MAEPGYEVVDVQLLVKSNINSSFNQIYSLTHPESGFKICTIHFEVQRYGPVSTTCYTEYVIDWFMSTTSVPLWIKIWSIN